MVKFQTKEEPEEPPIKATLEVDGDGDLTLRLDNVPVAYVCSLTGTLELFELRRPQREALSAKGIRFDVNDCICRGSNE